MDLTISCCVQNSIDTILCCEKRHKIGFVSLVQRSTGRQVQKKILVHKYKYVQHVHICLHQASAATTLQHPAKRFHKIYCTGHTMQASQHSGKYAKLNSKSPPSPPTFPPLLAREGFTDFTNIPLERSWHLFTPLW
jgi:hypothetical protein